MVDWLAGNRVRGTSTERTTSTGFNTGAPYTGTGGWKEYSRHTLGSNTAPITVSSIPDKRYYMVLKSWSGNTGLYERFNNDSGSNYSGRRSQNGGSLWNSTSETGMPWGNSGYVSGDNFSVEYIANLAGEPKPVIRDWVIQEGGTGNNSPSRVKVVNKYDDGSTNPVINRMDMTVGSGSLNSGSEMVVLYWDEDDTHTDNFWEELASVELSSANDLIDSGTFTAKKYLWIQIYNSAKPSGGNSYVYYNNVTTGQEHAGRSNTNGKNPATNSAGSDYQLTGSNGSIINHDISGSGSVTGLYTNMFVINTTSKEKFSIVYSASGWTTSQSVAPARFECVNKWTNTSDQITSVQCGSVGTSNYMGADSFIKVWGSD